MTGRYYIVTAETDAVPLNDHMMHGYQSKADFYDAVRQLGRLWEGHVGECIGERNGFLLLRFVDTPGGVPDEEWLPVYLLRPADPPQGAPPDGEAQAGGEVEDAFGFV